LSQAAVVRFKNIGKSFAGTRALDGVSFEVAKGEIHALLGENGAGKSTLLKILGGEIQHYEGEIEIEGKKTRFGSPLEAHSAGISIVHQELNLCNNLNVVDNVFLGKERKFKKAEKVNMIREKMKLLEIYLPLNLPVAHFSVAQKQMIEIIKATINEIKLLIMDEPTSALNSTEVEKLFMLMKKMKSSGVTIMFVSHRLEEVLQIADRITVLRDGKHIDTVPAAGMTKSKLVSMMVGREIVHKPRPVRDFSKEKTVLEVKNLSKPPFFQNCSFEIKRGEIVGIAGLEGCGRFELVQTVYGLQGRFAGQILFDGKAFHPKDPNRSIELGIGFIGQERKETGILSKMNLIANVTITLSRNDFLFRKKVAAARATEILRDLNVKYGSLHQLITSLSGGNQQKCIIGRILSQNPKLIIMEEPTRGIDVGSKEEIFKIVKQLASRGVAILIVSSELPELMNECDRILVMKSGRIVGEVFASETSQEEIMSMATGS